MQWFTQARRAYIYRTLIALGAVATGYGFLSENEIVLWGGLIAALLNVMPALNTSTKE